LLKIFGTPYNHKVIASTHVKNYIGKLTLADTTALISQAGAFVGNDGGLSHVAAALEVPTYVLFGPTDVEKNTVPMQNLHVIRTGLDCQPCQFGGKYPRAFTSHYIGCPVRMRCMSRLSVERVEATVEFG
jgi:ADP-heptose:LPS heptosyltransferase